MGKFHCCGLKSQTRALADVNVKEKHSLHLHISELWAEQREWVKELLEEVKKKKKKKAQLSLRRCQY